MALKRYVFAYDASDPIAWVRRYLATQNRSILQTLTPEHPERENPMRLREMQEERTAWERVFTESAATDYFGSSKWAVADADVLARDPTDAVVPNRMRAFLAAPPRTSSTFMHFANVELARGYLDRARALSPQFIDTLPTAAAQTQAVKDLWANLAAFFRAMNLRPWGWAKYRAALETQFGCYHNPAGTHIAIGERLHGGAAVENINPPLDLHGGLPRGMFVVRPTPLRISLPGSTPGRLRQEAYGRYLASYGPSNDVQGAGASVRFGTRSQIADGARTQPGQPFALACLDINTETGLATCTGPTGDIHPVWLTNAALLGGGLNYPPDPVAAGWADRYDCVPRSLVDGTTTGPDKTRLGVAGYYWGCGAMSPPYTGLSQLARLQRVWERPWASYLPPMLWYELLVWPLVQYLATVDPLQLVFEVQLDVLGKNLWTAIACGRNASEIGTQGILDGVATIAKIRGYLGPFNLVSGAVSGVVGLVNPIAGAVVALVGGAINVMEQATEHDPRYALDCFGRVEPCVDYLAIDPAGRPSDAVLVEQLLSVGAPPLAGVDAYEPPPAMAVGGSGGSTVAAPSFALPLSVTGILQAASRELHVVGMVPNATLAINGVPVDVRTGRWTDDNFGWSIPVPVTITSGMATVTITPPGEAPRSYQLPIRPEGVTNVAYAMMTTGPVLRLLRMVPGGLTSINGVMLDNATGRPDDNMTTWVLPLPAELTGPAMTVRVQAPDGTTRGATVPLASAGPTNVDYATLPAIGLPVPPVAPLPVPTRGDSDIEKPSRLPLLVGAVLAAVVIAGVVYYVVKKRRRKKNGRRGVSRR